MSDYLIEIVAKLRDEASSRIKDLQRAVDELKASAAADNATGDLTKGLSDAADEADRAAKSHQELQKQQEAGSRASRQSESDVKNLTKWQEQAAEEAAGHAESTENLRRQQELMSREAPKTEATVKRVSGLHAQAADSVASHAEAHAGLSENVGESSSEIDQLSRRLSDARDAMQRVQAGETALGSSTDHVTQSFMRTRQELNQLTQEYERYNAVIREGMTATDQAVTKTAQGLYAQKFSSIARRLPTQSPEFEEATRRALSARSMSQTPRDFAAEGSQLIGRMKQLDQGAQSHTASNSALSAGYTNVASGLRRVVNEMDAGSTEARKFGAALDEASQKSKNLNLARAGNEFTQFLQKVSSATDGIGVRLTSVSAALRGFLLEASIGLFQPIVTGLLSLAGGFFNVASGAGQAASAIGGVFVSGLGQMIPMMSIAMAALMRLKAVFAAVQASQAQNQENFFSPNQGMITQLQNTSQLIESEEQLKNAYIGLQDAQVQVKESQIALTQARIDAIRNLQDLVIAEQSAKLQLSESNLAVVQAQQALQKAQASGSQEGIAQARMALQAAQIQQETARHGVPRSEQDLALARGYGVAGSPGVLSAAEAARQAKLAVTQQQQAIAQAARQVKITQLTLAEPSSHETQQQSTLQYLLGQMSAPEKVLFQQLDSMEAQLRSPNSPLKKISDYILQPFSDAFSRLDALLSNRSFLAPITKLAQAMGGGLKSIFGTMFGSGGTSFFETMAGDATKSIPIVTRAITNLMKVFEDIAKSAAPAFNTLSRAWANFWGELNAKDSSSAGQERLTKFFNQGAIWAKDFGSLAGAVFDLFKALGHDAAPQGMKSVTSFTEAIHDATTWVQSHGPEVTNFFSQARQGLGLLGGVLFQIGRQLLQVFSLTSLAAFSQLLTAVVLPAARIVANVLGFLVTEFIKLLNAMGPLKDVIIGVATAFMGLLVLSKFISLVTRATTVLGGFKAAFDAFRNGDGIINRITSAWSALTDRISKGTKAMQDAKGANDALNASEAKSADLADTDAAAQARVDASESAGAAAGGADATAQTGLDAAEGAGGVGGLGAAGAVGGAAALSGAGVLGILGYGLYEAFKGQGNPTQNSARNTVDHSAVHKYLSPDQIQKLTIGATQGTGRQDANTVGMAPATVDLIQQANEALKKYASNGNASLLQNITNKAHALTREWPQNKAAFQQVVTAMDQARSETIPGLSQSMLHAQQQATALKTAWTQAFQGISAVTGNVMSQVQGTLAQNIANIAANLGTGTKQGAQALVDTISGAWSTVLANTSKAVRETGTGIKAIDDMLKAALKAYGVNVPSSISTALSKSIAAGNISLPQALSGSSRSALANYGGYGAATGAWHSAKPGGQIVNVAEGGHDEVTLTTDPRQAGRQRSLLSQYLSRAPHMAAGGFIPEPGTNFSYGEEPQIVAALRDLARALGVTIYGIYGYRSPTHSVEVGGFSNDPHTRGQAADIGVNSLLRSSASALTNAELAKFGLWRPFDMSGGDPAELNHVQLLPGAGGPAVAGIAPPKGSMSGSVLSAIASGGTSAATALQQLVAPKVKGVSGAVGAAAQGAVNLATTYANQFLSQFGINQTSKTGKGGISSAGIAPGSWMKVVQQIAAKMGWGGADISAWQGVENIEDGSYSLTAKNPTSEAYGLAQGITGPGWYYGEGGNPNTIVGQLTAMGNYIKGRYGNPIAALAHEHSAGWYAAGGLLGKHIRRMGIRHLRKKVMRFASGGRAPWGGEPVPIVAHEGERVVNPPQWDEIGRITGMGSSGLDHHLGYDGTPKQHFDGGGAVTTTAGQGHTSSPKIGSLSSINSFLSSLTSSLYTMDLGSVFGSLGTISKLFQVIGQGFGQIGKLGGAQTQQQLTKIGTLLENFADPNNQNSTLNMLAATFQRFQNNVNNWVTSMTYSGSTPVSKNRGIARVSGRRVVGTGDDISLMGGVLTGRNIGHTGQAASDLLGERALVEQSQYLQGQSSAVATAIYKVKQNISTVSHSKLPKAERDKAVSELQAAYNNLVIQQETLTNSMNSTLSQRYQQEQQYVQDSLNQVSDLYQTQQQQLQAKQSGAQSLGQYGKLPGLDQAIATSSQQQIAALQPVLKQAKKMNDADLVAQIQQQISSLQTTISQSTAQIVQDQLSGVEQTFQTISASQQGQQSSAQAMGQYGLLPAIDQAIIDSTTAHITALQGVLAAANASGNQAVAAQVSQEISQLQSTVAQTTAQMIQDSISAIQQTAQTQQGQVSMLQTISQTRQQSAGNAGQIAAAFGINAQALGLNQTSLQSQLSGYNSLLGTAIDTGNQGAIATLTQQIDQLTGQLVQNEQAMQDNTAQMISAEAQWTQGRGQFATGTLSGLAQVVTTIGQTTGYTNVPLLQQLTQGQNNVLGGTQNQLLGQLGQLGGGASGLAASLSGAIGNPMQFASMLGGANMSAMESGQDQTWITTFETLISNLTSNTEAIATNNQQLATLNGQLLQPQTWSTTAWTAFRNAIFSGMGNLLPQFQSALPAGAAPTIAPMFNPVSGNANSPSIGTLNINHAPTSSLSPQIIGEQLSYETSNAL